MRLTLRKQITTALVLFGLVPAAIVATFAWLSNEDFKQKQKILVRQAAQFVNNVLVPVFSPRFNTAAATKFDTLKWMPEGEDREKIQGVLRDAAISFNLDGAKVILVNPDNKVIASRLENGTFETIPMPGAQQRPIEDRYDQTVKNSNTLSGATELGGRSPELVGHSPVQFPNLPQPIPSGHGYVVLVTQPSDVAYSTIYGNQTSILGSSAPSFC